MFEKKLKIKTRVANLAKMFYKFLLYSMTPSLFAVICRQKERINTRGGLR